MVIKFSLKPLIYAASASSLISLMMSAVGDFQKINVYLRPTGLVYPPHTYVIVREFDRKAPDISNLKQAAMINVPLTNQKIGYAIAGIISGLAAFILSHYEDKIADLREYQEYASATTAKLDIDHEIAAYNKIAQEKATLKAYSLVEELASNPIYRKLKGYDIAAQEGRDYQDEAEEPQWNPFNETPDKDHSVSSDDVNKIVALYKANGNLEGAIFEITGINKSDSRFLDIVRQIKQIL